MKRIYILISILASLLFLSCEKVIELDLKDARPQIVVEANVNTGEGNNYVVLTRSGSFYDSNDFERISGAVVNIFDNNGNSYVLEEVEKGIYTDSVLSGNSLVNYSLKIDVENQTLSSSSTMPELVSIDSLSAEIMEGGMGGGPGGGHGGGTGDEEEPMYRVFCYFQDPVGVDNFYKLRATQVFDGYEYTESFIVNDDLFDGRTTKLGFREFTLMKGDTLKVELFSIDRANYEYYRLLEVNDMSSMSTSVGNPTSNVEGKDVIGVFGANAIDAEYIIIE